MASFEDVPPSEIVVPRPGVVHVLLDTNVLRALADTSCKPTWLNTFQEMASGGVAFSIFDFAAMEFLHQLLRDEVSASDYAAAMSAISSFLSRDLPLVPPYPQLLAYLGYPTAGFKSARHLAAYCKAVWRKVRSSKTRAQIEIIQTFVVDGWKFRLVPQAAGLGGFLADLRSGWIELLEKALSSCQEDLREIHRLGDPLCHPAARMRRDAQIANLKTSLLAHKTFPESKALANRMDCILEYILDRQIACAPRTGAYDPRSKRSRNDGLDLRMLDATLIPARVVTYDGAIGRRLAGLGRVEATWFLTPETLVSHWMEKGLAPLACH